MDYWKKTALPTLAASGITIGIVLIILAGIILIKNKIIKFIGVVLLSLITATILTLSVIAVTKVVQSKKIPKKTKYWMVPMEALLAGGQIIQIGYIDQWGSKTMRWKL
jgi:hypothetical protein